MLGHAAESATVTALLNPASAANTSAATSAWTSIAKGVGQLMLVCATGAVTGNVSWRLESAYDTSGTGAAGVTPNEGDFTTGVTANTCQKRTYSSDVLKNAVRVVGEITTGPALVSAQMALRLRA
jgi:hypothetical protein